jgi:hypothetical protein
LTFHPTLVNVHGLTNEDRQVCKIQVIPDKAPAARIISPTEEMAVAADEAIDIKFEAHDDHGVAASELVVYDETGAEEGQAPRIVHVQEIPLGDQQLEKYVTAEARLDLKQLNLAPGAAISYAIRVTDNRMVPQDADAVNAPAPKSRADEPQAKFRLSDADKQNDPTVEDADAGRKLAGAGRQAEGDRAGSETSALETMLAAAGQRSRQGGADDESAASQTDHPSAAEDAPQESPAPSSAGAEATTQSDARPVAVGDKPDDRSSENAATEANNPTNDNAKAEPDDGIDPAEPAERNREEDSGNTAIASNENANEVEDAGASAAPPRPENANAVASTADPRDIKEDTSLPTLANPAAQGGSASAAGSPPDSQPLAMRPQQAVSGQDTETGRRRLKITERLTAVAAAEGRDSEQTQIRDRVVQIDRMLAAIEANLKRAVEREIPDADRSPHFRALDQGLGDVETYIAQLLSETKDNEFAFVGLQMVDIGRSHVTPARDRVFVAIRDPADPDGHAGEALQHIVRARELLAALLTRYDRIARERQLASSLDETIKMYEVYVEKMQRLMREARQNQNPLERKMAVIEVDQEYLDRFAEVLTLRREMLREFGRMLADDPRLMARYLDLIKRRRASLRDQLSELAQRQDEIATELSGWQQVDETQREDLWMLVAETRLHATTPLAQDAAELAERVEKQMPLVLEPSHGTAARVVHLAREIAKTSRSISFDAQKLMQSAGRADGSASPGNGARQLVHRFVELEAALDRLNFESEGEEEVASYVNARLLESRTVADQAEAWALVAGHLQDKKYHGLAEVDQQKLAIATELLRIEMLGIEEELAGEFQQQTGGAVPAELLDLVRTLHRVMEAVSLNQAAATFAMTRNRLGEAELQQAKALEGFDRAEELFDQIRRAAVAALDEADPPDPEIADLLDPTLDEFLAQLEREPNIEAQLGIPNRPRNLRVIAESLTWQQTGPGMLGQSGEAARQRARQEMKMQRKRDGEKPPSQREPTEQEREQMAKEQEMQDMLARSLASIEERAKDPQASPQERRKLEQMAENMRRMLDQAEQTAPDPQAWEKLAEADQAREILQALARGETIPDQQWNKLLSTLEDGLWQVGGRTPPADYRKAIEQYQDRIRQLMNTDR